jgi:uncharacterized membrane protein
MPTKTTLIAASAVASVAAWSVAHAATPVAAPTYAYEKCYGVNAPLKNDCAVAGLHSCGGESRMANDPKSWIYVPTGTCAKIQGGNSAPKA